MTKYALVDQIKMGENIEIKKAYFHSEIPNSSIDVISKYITPFDTDQANSFRAEVKDYFIKACAYVHPSKKQIEEQLANAKNGTTIGFETSKMFANMNSLIFRAYDMLLVMIFHGFGESMSGDIFIQVLDENTKWKYHKGKYTKEYSKKFDYKHECQTKVGAH